MLTRRTADRQTELPHGSPAWVKPSAALRPRFLSLAHRVSSWMATQSAAPLLIGVTSLSDRAGKSTVCFNLAAALAGLSRQRVLVVESSLGPSYVLGGRTARAGWVSILAATVTVGECALLDVVPGVDVVAGQRAAHRQARSLPWEVVPRLVTEQMADYPLVLFDLPTASQPLFPWLAVGMHGLILVLEERGMSLPAVDAFQRELPRGGGELMGIVINKAERRDSVGGP